MDVEFYNNIKWKDIIGEVDIVMCEKGNCQNVLALVEIKGRFFDVSYGYEQSGPNRSAKKTVLIINSQQVTVPPDIPCFVVTVIPENEFQLGVESNLKLDIQKYTLLKESAFSKDYFNYVYQ